MIANARGSQRLLPELRRPGLATFAWATGVRHSTVCFRPRASAARSWLTGSCAITSQTGPTQRQASSPTWRVRVQFEGRDGKVHQYNVAPGELRKVQPRPGDVEDIGEMLRVWDLTTFYPRVFHIAVQDVAEEQKRAAFSLLKAYIIRREMCDLTSKNYNNVVLRCIQRLRSVGIRLEYH